MGKYTSVSKMRDNNVVWSKRVFLEAKEPAIAAVPGFDMFSAVEASCADVVCVQESSGYAVWYERKLAQNDERFQNGVENGLYLLRFFAPPNREDAIEYAVLAANNDRDAAKQIRALDSLVPGSIQLEGELW
jgi:hypothetical protein